VSLVPAPQSSDADADADAGAAGEPVSALICKDASERVTGTEQKNAPIECGINYYRTLSYKNSLLLDQKIIAHYVEQPAHYSAF
jgi:hypothetical protein